MAEEVKEEILEEEPKEEKKGLLQKAKDAIPVSYTHLTLPTTPYV